jgi:two-component system, OmpR family, KDP operon response regulator KdpE
MSDVLVLSDNRIVRRQIANVLRHGEFEVRAARDVREAGGLLRRHQFAAVVVTDLVGVEPRDVVEEIRTRTEQPILVVSRNAEEYDKVTVLDAGADDYLTQPYGIEELLARLRATLRRFERARDEPPIVTDDFTAYVHDRRLIAADGSEPRLTATEWKLLEVLLRHAGHLVSHSDALRSVWGPDAIDKTQYLRVHMTSIRRKIEPDPAHPRYFLTVPGLGLRFVPSATRAQGSAS